MTYANTSSFQCFMSKTDSYIILVNFISESDFSMYGFRVKFICKNKSGVSTFIEIGIHTLMEHEQQYTIQKKTRTHALPNIRNTILVENYTILYIVQY
jgi:hypothetical protein